MTGPPIEASNIRLQYHGTSVRPNPEPEPRARIDFPVTRCSLGLRLRPRLPRHRRPRPPSSSLVTGVTGRKLLPLNTHKHAKPHATAIAHIHHITIDLHCTLRLKLVFPGSQQSEMVSVPPSHNVGSAFAPALMSFSVAERFACSDLSLSHSASLTFLHQKTHNEREIFRELD